MKITMISHCCLLIELGDKRVLTDPWMTEPLYWGRLYHRFGLGMTVEELPALDLVLASHGHEDHLDPATLRRLDKSTPVAVLETAARKVERLGFGDVRPMRAGATFDLDGLSVHACFGRHPGGLVTYLLHADDGTVFFAGDSVYDDRLLEVGDRFSGIDASLLPVSGGRALFGLVHLHMGPEEALRVARGIGTAAVIPTHYHFELRGVPSPFARSMDVADKADELVRLVSERSPELRAIKLDVGQSWDGPSEAGAAE